jgi:N-dimethylarginine dimethylaminohydrolase
MERISVGGMTEPRRYLMCPPTYFAVDYAINPWMDPAAPVDVARAVAQWTALRDTYTRLGHRVELIDPLPGLPDMVFAANGATVVDGVVYGAQFRFPERAPEAPAYLSWFARAGFEVHAAKEVNEGEGDLLTAGRYLLAGMGFRTEHAAHLEAQEIFGRPVISLQLVDPRYYHLDTALCVLDADTIAYYPRAFSEGSQRVLRQLFPDAIRAGAADAAVLGLNAVSDGRRVVLPAQASGLIGQLADRGYLPVPVDLSELRKAGGGPKCATLEVRA